MAYFVGSLMNTKRLNAFVVIAQTLLFVFQRSPDYCNAGDGARYVLVKHQNILNEVMRRCLQEQMLRGRKKMYACMGQTLAFLLELQCVTVMVSLRLLITSELETISLASEVSRCCSLSAVKVLRSNEGLM